MRTTEQTKILFKERLAHILVLFLQITHISITYNEHEEDTLIADIYLCFKNTVHEESILNLRAPINKLANESQVCNIAFKTAYNVVHASINKYILS